MLVIYVSTTYIPHLYFTGLERITIETPEKNVTAAKELGKEVSYSQPVDTNKVVDEDVSATLSANDNVHTLPISTDEDVFSPLLSTDKDVITTLSTNNQNMFAPLFSANEDEDEFYAGANKDVNSTLSTKNQDMFTLLFSLIPFLSAAHLPDCQRPEVGHWSKDLMDGTL